MEFHFISLLLIDGSSFFLLVFFQFSILSTIDNAPREHLIENKARLSLFFVFIIKISAISAKEGIISENIRWEISTDIFFADSVFEYMLLFFLQWKKWQRYISALLFFSTCLENHFTVFAAALQSLYVLRGNIYSRCIFPFSAWFAFNWFFRSSTPFLPVKRFFRLTGKSSSDMSDTPSPQDFSKIFSLSSSESLV